MEKIHRCNTCAKEFRNTRGLVQHWSKCVHKKLAIEEEKVVKATELKIKRLSIPMEGGSEKKKIRGGTQYYDLNILEAQMKNNDNTFNDYEHDWDDLEDDSYYGKSSVDNEDDEEDDESDSNNCSYATMVFNMNQQLMETSSGQSYLNPCHPELNEGVIVCYYEYQVLLYAKLYGPIAINATNIMQFKESLDTERDIDKTSRMMEIYTFAKDNSISRLNGDRLLKLVNHDKDSSFGYTSWKTFDRWIQKETDFYVAAKKTSHGLNTGIWKNGIILVLVVPKKLRFD